MITYYESIPCLVDLIPNAYLRKYAEICLGSLSDVDAVPMAMCTHKVSADLTPCAEHDGLEQPENKSSIQTSVTFLNSPPLNLRIFISFEDHKSEKPCKGL
jgi:hypothetical protein